LLFINETTKATVKNKFIRFTLKYFEPEINNKYIRFKTQRVMSPGLH
jgi:hypothetical protein